MDLDQQPIRWPHRRRILWTLTRIESQQERQEELKPWTPQGSLTPNLRWLEKGRCRHPHQESRTMRIMLGLLHHRWTWRNPLPYHQELDLILWTTISRLFWLIRKPRMWRRTYGPSLRINRRQGNWTRKDLTIKSCWRNLQIKHRQRCLEERRPHWCPRTLSHRSPHPKRPLPRLHRSRCWRMAILRRRCLIRRLWRRTRPRCPPRRIRRRIIRLINRQELLGRRMGWKWINQTRS